MIAKRKFNHSAAGLLNKFMSRNNDYQGYWALGVLYTEAHTSNNRVELDLLGQSAQPASLACTSLARTWAICLHQALGRQGISLDGLAAASISIVFGMPPVPNRYGLIGYGDLFQCSLRLVSRDGRVFVRQREWYCLPHEEFQGLRSTRFKA